MIKKKVTYISDEGFEFKFEPIEDSLKIKKIKTGFEARYLIQSEGFDPREDDNIGIMVCFHKRYTLGDKLEFGKNIKQEFSSDDFNGWEEMKEHLIKTEKAICILPLYLYDHSGISMKVGSFQGLLPQGHAEFDSGQVGFIYTTKKQMEKIGVEKYSKKKIEEYLIQEVETYNQYITGDCYSLVKETYNKDKEQINYDILGGFFGYNDSLKALKTEI